VSSGMSYGLSCAGYDVRLARDETLVSGFTTVGVTLEHMDFPPDLLGLVKDKSTWARKGVQVQNTVIEPGWRGHLAVEMTYQPVLTKDLAASALTYKRVMKDLDVTGDEKLDEVIRHTKLLSDVEITLVIRAGTPIAQVIVYELTEPAERPYGSPGSSFKYQDQSLQDFQAKLEEGRLEDGSGREPDLEAVLGRGVD
jgi:deoxycytidine triphosphate deaminase